MSETHYAQRTDGLEEKLRLLRAAHEAGNFDLGMSLAASIGDTLQCERQLQAEVDEPISGADTFVEVTDLPAAQARWARGWAFCKVLEVREVEGLDRRAEAVDVPLAFAAGQVADLRREIRVARLEGTGLREVVSQVYGERYISGQRHCRLVFSADVPAAARATYLVFYGNSYAELPDYTTGLEVRGEGYGLDVENGHYVAHLSRQMGQLERLVYKGGHGLELFAGGEGHGEPPNIDWAHDYLASNNFQKFRVTNWAECPNWEVVRGPLCVQVRRWGFPHSPAHPLFTPSRMHIDVTYTFYAGQPYLLKRGSMEMIRDFELNYLRDDEWVFSGYSFTDAVWMDREGILHEGAVAEGHHDDLWGTGFFNRRSGDGFIALWLEHSAENYDGLYHSGAPAIDYRGHGQLWSRWAARDNPQFKAGAVLKQFNAYLVGPYEGPEKVQETRRRLLAPLQVSAGEGSSGMGGEVPGMLARAGEEGEEVRLKERLWNALSELKDGMFYGVDANVVDMGYIYDLRVRSGIVEVLMTMPHRGRPKYGFIGEPMRRRLLELEGVDEVVVRCTWEPPWSLARLSEEGRAAMGLEK